MNEKIFYVGIVENNNDPLKLGRVQVRIIGLHTADKELLPTSKLPFASVLMPADGSSVSGVGSSPTGITNGAWTQVIFLDAEKQLPVVMGVYPGIPQPQVIYTENRNIDSSQPNAVTNPVKEVVDTPADLTPIDNIAGRDIDLIVVHCTATRPNQNVSMTELNRWFVEKDYSSIGYHYVISRDGNINNTRPITQQGAHALGYNAKSIGISLMGGVDDNLTPENNFTTAQFSSLTSLIRKFAGTLQNLHVIGHNQISSKACPSFDVQQWLSGQFDALKADSSWIAQYSPTTRNMNAQPLASHPDSNQSADKTEAFKEDVVKGTAEYNPKYSYQKNGFTDPDKQYPRKDTILEVSTNRLARNENIDNTIVKTKRTNVINDIPKAIPETKWSEPPTPYNAQYPFNKVVESRSGHIIEIDDTPGAERLQTYHKSGTFEEIHPNGQKVTKIVGKNYLLVLDDENIYIKGACNLTVVGDANVLVQHDCNLNVVNDMNVKVTGNYKQKVTGNYILAVEGNKQEFIKGSIEESGGSTKVENIAGNYNITTARMDINK